MEIIRTEQIVKQFNNNETVLKGIDIAIPKGTFTVILGQSGSGKSTLLNIMSGLLKPSSGRVIYKERDITKMSKKDLSDVKRNEISNIFQSYLLLPELTAKENIMVGKSKLEAGLPYEEIVSILGIEEISHKFPSQLSGGQQQRVSIARALMKNPCLLFCDEATGSLDQENSKTVVSLLQEVKRKYGVTVVFTTHNLQIAQTADRIITIKDGTLDKDCVNEKPALASDIEWGIHS